MKIDVDKEILRFYCPDLNVCSQEAQALYYNSEN